MFKYLSISWNFRDVAEGRIKLAASNKILDCTHLKSSSNYFVLSAENLNEVWFEASIFVVLIFITLCNPI